MGERKDNNSNDKDKYVVMGIDLANSKDVTVRYNPTTKEYATI